jgi:hypothetical protein
LDLGGLDARQGGLSPPGSQGRRSPRARRRHRRRRGRLGPVGREGSVRVAGEVEEGRANSIAGLVSCEWGEAARRRRGVLGGPEDTPVSNHGQVNARQGEISARQEWLP